jgi:DNA repair photolyase
MAKRFGKPWGDTVKARPGIVEAVQNQLVRMQGQGKKIMLCFTCDPYPVSATSADSMATREVIRAIKASGNHIQILTKGADAYRDFALLDENDSFGVTLTGDGGGEPGAASHGQRVKLLYYAAEAGIHTWASCEPVLYPPYIFKAIEQFDFVNLWRIGKLNHRKSDIDWRQFGHDVEALCKSLGRNYYIKEDLRAEMEKPCPK